MKKLYGALVLVLGVVLLTGCGSSSSKSNSFTCTAKVEENGQKADVTFEVKTDDNGKSVSADAIFDYESKDYADQMVSTINFVNAYSSDDTKIDFTQDGKKITIKDYHKLVAQNEVDEDEDEDDGSTLSNIVGLTKDEFKKTLEKMDEAKDVSCK